MRKLYMIALLALCACSIDLGQPSNAQAVGPSGRSVIRTIDGGICTGQGTTASPLDCHLTVDTSSGLGGLGVSGNTLNATVSLSEITFALLGDGSDGAFHFDGSTTLTMHDGQTVAPVGSSPAVYSLVNELFCAGCTIDSGVEVRTMGFGVFDTSTLTLNGKIQWNGNAASGATGGAALVAEHYGEGGAGGNGGAGGGGASSVGACPVGGEWGPNGTWCSQSGGAAGSPGTDGVACKGGGGGNGGDGAASGSTACSMTAFTAANFRIFTDSLNAMGSRQGTNKTGGGAGGGGGRGASTPTTAGGGGGGGGGYVVVHAKKIVGSGSIESKGGAGANGAAGNNTGGGGGGGGGTVIVLIATGSNPTITVTGGAKGTGQGTGANGGNGGPGLSEIYKVGL